MATVIETFDAIPKELSGLNDDEVIRREESFMRRILCTARARVSLYANFSSINETQAIPWVISMIRG